MRKRPEILALVAAGSLFANAASGQPNLPPPPPPPIDQKPEVPSLPPPPPRPEPDETPPAQAPARRTPPPPPPYRPSVRARRADDVHRPDDDVVYLEPPARPVALTLNPIGLVRGRLSANLEVQLEPHHSLVFSPNFLLWNADRGTPDSLESDGLGFATRTSSSIGVEVGYHYWWRWARELRGPFIGPALLVGSTTDAAVGDPSHGQTYWGLALDIGWQEVLPGGFTVGVGAGLETVRMADTGSVVPRVLLQLGWSL